MADNGADGATVVLDGEDNNCCDEISSSTRVDLGALDLACRASWWHVDVRGGRGAEGEPSGCNGNK